MEERERRATCKQAMDDCSEDGERERVKVKCNYTDTAKRQEK
jgi:hypothetical protein